MKDKNSVLFKEMDLVFVYIVIFCVGLLIVLLMTNYIKSKIEEIDYVSFSYTTNN